MPEKEPPHNHQTLPNGRAQEPSLLTLTRTMGVGTGELVDKIDWEVGDMIDGRFEVTEVIGWGGMGVVYKVHHLEWNLDLAVKMPLASLVADAASKARFIREAQTWVDLGLHPNIVQCWYVRELGGIPRVFMDYLTGGSLRDWIRQSKVKPGEWDRILDLLIQACDGLGYAHEHGVKVHRDVKPGNLLLTEQGELRVTDFGIVKQEGVAEIVDTSRQQKITAAGHALTMTGSELGTPEYGAPEQWGDAKNADGRADIYALGVILFELCCGRRPFDDGVQKEMAHVLIGRHIASPPPDPRTFNAQIPPALAELILQCLAKAPDKRPAAMPALRELLVRLYENLTGKNYRRPVPQAAELRSDALNNRAVSFLDLGRKKDAFEIWKEALKLDAYQPEVVYNSAVLEWTDGLIADDEVVKRLEAIKLNNRRINFYLGLVHLERAAAEEAERELAEACNDAELAAHSMLWRALGDAYIAQEKYAAAETAYQKALAILPGDFASLEGQTLAQVQTRQEGNQLLFPWLRCQRVFAHGHEQAITAVAVTADGRFGVSGSRDSTLRLWDLATAECLRVYDRYRTAITAVALTPDGRFIISGSDDGTLCLWKFEAAEYVRLFEGHKAEVTAAAVTPDGLYLVSGSQDHALRLWELATGKCARTFEGHQGGVNAVALAPNGRFLVSGGQDHALRLWDVMTGKCMRTFEGHHGAVTAAAVAPNGSFIVSGSADGTLGVWDVATAKRLHTFQGHRERVNSAAIAPAGTFMVSGSADGTVRLWNLLTAKCLRTFQEHQGDVTAVAITPDGRFIISGSADQTLRLWNLETWEHRNETTIQVCRQRNLGELQLSTERFRKWLNLAHTAWEKGKPAVSYKYLAQARRIPGYERAPEALALSAGIGAVLPRKGLQGVWFLGTCTGHRGEVTAVAVTPDGRYAVSGSADKTLRLWELATAKCLRTFEGHAAEVTAAAITPDGRFVVSGSADNTLRLWDLATAKCLRVYAEHTLAVTAVAISPYGQFLVSGSKDRTLRLWNPATAKCVQIFKGAEQGLTTVAVTPDARFILAGSSGRNVYVWERPTAKSVLTFAEHKKGVTAVTVASNGQFALSGSKDKTLRLWELATRENLGTFQGHADEVTAVALTSDARFALSGSSDKTLRLWNCLTGESAWVFEGHRLGVTAAAMTADGRFVVSGSADSTLRVWELDWELDAAETGGLAENTKSTGKSPRFLTRIAGLLNKKK